MQKAALLGRALRIARSTDGVGGGTTPTVSGSDVAAASAGLRVVVPVPRRSSRYVVLRETAGGEYVSALLLATDLGPCLPPCLFFFFLDSSFSSDEMGELMDEDEVVWGQTNFRGGVLVPKFAAPAPDPNNSRSRRVRL